MIITKKITKEIEEILIAGGVGVIPTDTIYGIVGSALKKETVERIYRLRARNPKKPMIVLISSMTDLKNFDVFLDRETKKIVSEFWHGKRPTSIILPLNTKHSSLYTCLNYLHRGKGSIAFRLPVKKLLQNLLKKTGPLVAPSVNIEGHPPAKTMPEAKKYFHDHIDFYVDGGEIEGKSSRLIKITERGVDILRK